MENQVLLKADLKDNVNDEANNLWSQIPKISVHNLVNSKFNSSSMFSIHSANSPKRKVTHDDGFTPLPLCKNIDNFCKAEMIDLTNKFSSIPKYIVAPDGYIPNSQVRHNYPPLFTGNAPGRKKPKTGKDDDDEYIKKILLKHLASDKIKDVRNRQKKTIKKTHYVLAESDLMAIQAEVTNDLNFEIDQAVSEHVSHIKVPKKVNKLKPAAASFIDPKLKHKVSRHLSNLDDASRKLNTFLSSDISEEKILYEVDIDILDTLEKEIEECDKLGLTYNEKINERIKKDRKLRMSDAELKSCLELLEGVYGSKRDMYNALSKAFNRHSDSIELLEMNLKSRQKRLEFLNTLTDPHHIFKYLLNFYENRSELIDNIQDVLMGSDKVNQKQFLMFCGENYKLQDFFKEFVVTKNFANSVLSKMNVSEKDRLVGFEKCLRDGIISESILFNVFMSSEIDAKRFFECIPECNMQEMIEILENMKDIQKIQTGVMSQMTKAMSDTTINTEALSTVAPTSPKEMRFDKFKTITLPSLPEFNENSWKNMISQYISNMLVSIAPSKKVDTEDRISFIEDSNVTELIKELSYLHSEVLRLLNVYLGNDTVSAKKLLDGLIAEDELAYQALIELIGEREAFQIIKSLRLKQAKLIEKIIECHGDERQMLEAKYFLRGMMHNLPPSLSANLNMWLSVGNVTAADISQAIKQLKVDSATVLNEEIDDEIEVPNIFFNTRDKRSRASISTKNFSVEEFEEKTKGPLRRKSMVRGNIEIEYRDLAERDNATGVLYDRTSQSEPIPSSNLATELQEKSLTITQSQNDLFSRTEAELVPGDELLIEPDECQEICKTPWFTAEPTVNYESMIVQLTDLVGECENTANIQEIKTIMGNLTARTIDHQTRTLIAERLIGQVVALMEENEEMQTIWKDRLSKISEDQSLEHAKPSNVATKVDDLTKITVDKVLKIEPNKNLEDAIKSSYSKHIKIKNLVELLKTFEKDKADELLKIIKKKKNICSIFVPEFNERVTILRDMGMEFLEPIELLVSKPGVIMRKDSEELKRTVITSNKVEDHLYQKHLPKASEVFWENAAITLKLQKKVSADVIIPSTDDQLTDSCEVGSLVFSSSSDSPISNIPKPKTAKKSSIDSIKVPPAQFTAVSNLSIMSFKEATMTKPIRLKDNIYKADYVDEDVIDKDEISLKYDIGQSRLFPKKVEYQRRPRDPYYDFHSIYGPTAYYLPYIRPEKHQKRRSREDSVPQYSSTEHQENMVYDNIRKKISGLGTSKSQDTPTLTRSHFLRRPSGVPLSDWVKLGAPGMASNMVVSSQTYKADNSQCRYHHLTKLKLHKYGLSATRYLDRCDMLEFISKANSATKHDNVRSKLEGKSRLESIDSESSGSLLKSF